MKLQKSKRKKKSNEKVDYITTGSILLNLILSQKGFDGGWKMGRIVNIVGDKSTGKTGLVLETIANYVKKGVGKVIYDEPESAFDFDLSVYKLTEKDIVWKTSDTVEDWYDSVSKELENGENKLYVLDSMDALSDLGEIKRDIRDGSYGTKAKVVGELLRRLVRKIKEKNMLLMVVSQVRDNIGVQFGEKHKRSGGKALDFYASQVLWLAVKEKIKKKGRVVGVNIVAKVKKNKVAPPFREASFPFYFDYGIDDIGSLVDYLIAEGVWKKEGKVVKSSFEGLKPMQRDSLIRYIEDKGKEKEVRELVINHWFKIEEELSSDRKSKW